jgi:5-methylcytosine-specific restriction endonuclease McrA
MNVWGCRYDFLCADKECELQLECDIYKKVVKISKLKCWCFNYWDKKRDNAIAISPITRNIIKKLYLAALKEGFYCPDCGCKMKLGGGDTVSSSIDHIRPRGLNGTNDPDNLRIICIGCNQRKSIKENPDILYNSQNSRNNKSFEPNSFLSQILDRSKIIPPNQDCKKELQRNE